MAGEAATTQVEPGEDAFPGAGVDVIVRGPESQLAVERLTWGFPVEWQQRPVYNTRLETAMGPNPGMWEQPIVQGRGIVVTADSSKRMRLKRYAARKRGGESSSGIVSKAATVRRCCWRRYAVKAASRW